MNSRLAYLLCGALIVVFTIGVFTIVIEQREKTPTVVSFSNGASIIEDRVVVTNGTDHAIGYIIIPVGDACPPQYVCTILAPNSGVSIPFLKGKQ